MDLCIQNQLLSFTTGTGNNLFGSAVGVHLALASLLIGSGAHLFGALHGFTQTLFGVSSLLFSLSHHSFSRLTGSLSSLGSFLSGAFLKCGHLKSAVLTQLSSLSAGRLSLILSGAASGLGFLTGLGQQFLGLSIGLVGNQAGFFASIIE